MQLHPEKCDRNIRIRTEHYTVCTCIKDIPVYRMYLFDVSTSTQQIAQALRVVFVPLPSSSFNQHNTVMIVNYVIFSNPLLLVLPKINPDFSVCIYSFFGARDQSLNRPIAIKPEHSAPLIS